MDAGVAVLVGCAAETAPPQTPSHVGGRFTTVPRKEIGKGLLAAMLKDLDMDKEAF